MEVNRTLKLCLLIVAVCMATSVANSQTPAPPPPAAEYNTSAWKTFTSPEGGFEISFPGVPSSKAAPVDTDLGRIVYHMSSTTSTAGEYAVSYVDFPFSTTDPAAIKQILDGAVAEVVTNGGTKLTELDVTIDGHLGREFMLQRGEWIGRHWVFFVEGRMYAVILAVHPEVAFKDGKPSSDTIARTDFYNDLGRRFFGSFRFIERKPSSPSSTTAEETDGLLSSVSEKSDLYPAKADAAQEISTALQRAGAEHKRVLLVFGANWCYDCHVLDHALHEGEAGKIVAEKFLLVHVDIGEGEKNPELVKEYKIPLDKGVPAVAVLDENGKLLYSSGEGEFEAARRMLKKDLLIFLKRWRPL